MRVRTATLITALALAAGTLPAAAQDTEKSMCLDYRSETFVERSGTVVTQADFDGFLQSQVPANQQQGFLRSPKRIGEVLETLLSTYSMAERASQTDWYEQPAYQAQLNIALTRELAEEYRKQYLASQELESYEDAAREIYIAEPGQFETPRTYSFNHLLISEQEGASEIEMMRRAMEAYDRIESGEDFQAVVDELASESAKDQVQMEGIELESLVPPLRAMLNDSDIGDVMAPVRSQYGWHVVQTVAIQEPTQLSWEEAQAKAEGMARQRHRRMVLERLRQDIQSEAPNIVDGAVADLLARYDVTWEDGASIGDVSAGMSGN